MCTARLSADDNAFNVPAAVGDIFNLFLIGQTKNPSCRVLVEVNVLKRPVFSGGLFAFVLCFYSELRMLEMTLKWHNCSKVLFKPNSKRSQVVMASSEF